ncbi:uracil-DNA glycosylase [Salisediminibacterium halotolerans]|uniref:uracil-DNA glycosylase n=1 Tax=Salisediminibacterium halotolerans TaxID=517425 RepID=UPI000F23F945|nr:uracil-DNA glycosylase [Salisediminibacterium halotolerans]RLJ69659.1 uracil-DNA glycosylase [Actinophytocola xinjiangensis]RPE89717.1 uracil-DNA glycosylase [Salisediminibacterium halotolerans]TWG32553.1 uracil-DNA glycosylase [Salisediminibacterium halotolerans]GEL08444.1 uracil-DNA glycosylase [Salisediminibacterium halotolerans]
MNPLDNDWRMLLNEEFSKAYYLELREFLKKEYSSNTVYPPMNDIFNALHRTAYHETKAVIIGQDPYHGEGQAHGLSFSVRPHVKVPPSLKNVFKELHSDLGCPVPEHGCLQSWADEGVLLLNSVLTVRHKTPNAHKGAGWERFTDEVIRQLNLRDKPLVFLLWGKYAQEKGKWIDRDRHLVIHSSHPSPFSAHRGFFGSRPFSRVNEFLQATNQQPIRWEIPPANELT